MIDMWSLACGIPCHAVQYIISHIFLAADRVPLQEEVSTFFIVAQTAQHELQRSVVTWWCVCPFSLSTARNRLLQVPGLAAGIKQSSACSMHTCCKAQHNLLQPAASGLERMLKAMCIMLRMHHVHCSQYSPSCCLLTPLMSPKDT